MKEEKQLRNRFKRIEKGSFFEFMGCVVRVYVVEDLVTNVLYLCACNGEGVGLTVMVDREGKPLTSKED